MNLFQATGSAFQESRKLSQLPRRTTQLAAVEPGQRPYDICFEETIFRLRRYSPSAVDAETAATRETPIFIFYPFINDPSILDFHPDRSVIGEFLGAGFPVYVLEWLDASPLDSSIGLADTVLLYLDRAIDVACEETDAETVHLWGYSTSAPIVASYAGVSPERVETLLLQGPPLDYSAGEGIELLRNVARTHDPDTVAEMLGVIAPQILESAFLLRKPVEYSVTNPLRLWDHLDDAAFIDTFGRKLTWTRGGPALPGTFYRDFVQWVIIENRLIHNELVLHDRHVDLDAIEMPVLLIVGHEDKFVPPDASLPFLDAIASKEKSVIEVQTGHVGLSTDPIAFEVCWPRAREWVCEHS